MAEPKDTYFRRAINWMYGDDAYLHEFPSKDVSDKHINELLGLHPYHPYNPELPVDSPCFKQNQIFYDCMEADHVEGYELYQKHVACFEPYKKDLMKCLAREKRKARLSAQRASEAAQEQKQQ